ncbi:prolyl-tRNA synthetase [Lentithecium fluviatile CBS 122367]|uniref:proline--tRNA ligase n=1 Tax=Lentithecium fluviatile CBS 122367 TaxID=1168545 RepID=A0A6G1JLJ1_9PLEO|nr:prolyl-tRNA synthetase [Lentithecium fluviatile CBS 122367]
MKAHIWRETRRTKLPIKVCRNARFLATDSRNRLSNFWAPTGGISPQDGEQDDSHVLLILGGFLRQAHSGVFHLLPLGLRVQNKLENLIDKHMQSIGASKLSLSSITTETLWKQSRRYSANSELLRVQDRRKSGFLLSPTHEEEITSLVGGTVHSYKDLPLRLYQIGRKYRDERRPRQGLLRAKEFLMKDLYTFDYSQENALKTYDAVRQAYNNLFDELKLPYLVADADSGNMGGKLSHEYHFVSAKGEDSVWSCDSCDYVANEELVEKKTSSASSENARSPLVFTGISSDRSKAINIHIPWPSNFPTDQTPMWDQVSDFVNLHAVKKAGADIDTGIEAGTLQSLLTKTKSTEDIYDCSLSSASSAQSSLDLTTTKTGDSCPHCSSGKLSVQKAIEVGHTFHLGTRYSEPLQALVAVPDKTQREAIHMGCHGIGVSRLIGAIASLLAEEQRLNWPRVIAPYESIVIASPKVGEADVIEVYDGLAGGNGQERVDVALDDRPLKSLGWKLKDADLIGYPVVVVLGSAWVERREVEVQCRRFGVKKHVALEDLRGEVLGLLDRF